MHESAKRSPHRPGRHNHDSTGTARNHRKMGSGKKRHQRWQLGRSKRQAAR